MWRTPLSTTQQPRRYTCDDLADCPDDGLRRELIDGELIVSPSPVPPDVLLLPPEPSADIGDRSVLSSPDVVVEISSPSTPAAE